jgi:hypothetical protein
MNTKVLLLGAVVSAFTFTTFATDTLLSPRAAGNQIKHVASSVAAPASAAVAYVAPAAAAQLSPRAQDNQIKVVTGTVTERNQYLECRNAMTGSSPKAIGACNQNAAMSGCVTVALQK